uniref:Uncharacterized protein n=1 Tax=Aegilops tauschii subsp. strangulata TaxID=200361 RepID=A0A453GTU1_AEGTS
NFFKCKSTVTNAQLVILRTAVICCFPSFLVQGRNEYEYDRWSQYKAFCNTPDADREYVLYWEKMVKEMKWLENHVLKDFLEWEPMRCKGLYQSVKIASGFTNIDLDLACHGFEEYVWRTRLYRLFVEGLDRAFLEIWKRVNEDQTSFRDALQEVYNDNPVPSRRHTLKAELERPGGFLQLERQFRRCTEGISKEVNVSIVWCGLAIHWNLLLYIMMV